KSVSRMLSQKWPPNPTWRKTPSGGNKIAKMMRIRSIIDSRSGASRPGEVPDDQAEDRQDKDEQDPQNLRSGGSVASEDIYDRPDVGDQNNKAENEFHELLRLCRPTIEAASSGRVNDRSLRQFHLRREHPAAKTVGAWPAGGDRRGGWSEVKGRERLCNRSGDRCRRGRAPLCTGW